jgi:ATP-dependent DNA ligase
MIELYRRHSSGSIGTWKVWAEKPEIVYAYTVVEGGAIVTNRELITSNNSGRGWDDQAELEMQARARRKRQRGYKDSIQEALSAFYNTSEDGLLLPMLAVRIEKSSNRHSRLRKWVQPKLNGHRCMVVKTTDGEMIAKSRLGTRITTIDHLLEALKPNMPDDLPIDGELYVHGFKLQTIASIVKRAQSQTDLVTFQTYDVADPDLSYESRLEELKKIIRPAWQQDSRINIVNTDEVDSVDEAYEYFGKYRAMKYEGAMLRIAGSGYMPGGRSHYLLKLKAQEDGEFRIASVELSSRGVPVLNLLTEHGLPFKCTAPGTNEEKLWFLNNPSVIGRMMTCEFAEWTAAGIPFHCVALQLREDI